ncbi:RimK/LysX family protein [uncultured Maricaulis sp.]|uniref:ATP-dependent zinc protease family protein n=1 Tax=uncultured Maricaulis sp. TaxID=174710 RepID=UPI0030DD3A0D|tara:strand:- start:49213 stop:49692 length:480 start_codon:yes stop_codon:yes gene_type:complete
MTPARPIRTRTEIGWREIVGLPTLDIPALHAKIDTGARTSALNAVIIRELDQDGAKWVAFDVTFTEDRHIQRCLAPIADRRDIKNTSGVPELRYVIETQLTLGSRHWQIELSLADREPMKFDLILGRTALRNRHICINPGRSFLSGPPAYPLSAKAHSA